LEAIRSTGPVRLGDGHLDLERGAVVRAGRAPVELARRDVEVLRRLVEHPGCVDRETLASTLDDGAGLVDHRVLDHIVSRLRLAIEPDPRRPVHILTERGRGYRWVGPSPVAALAPRAAEADTPILVETTALKASRALVSSGFRVTWFGVPGCGASTLAKAVAAPPGGDAPQQTVAVGPMSPAEGRPLLEARLSRLSVPIPPADVLARLVAATGGHPWTLCRVAERAVFLPAEALAALAEHPPSLLPASQRSVLRAAFASATNLPTSLLPEPLFSAAAQDRSDE
jgi:DNA-binding winged helix-turn-helix (wHTH) protein